jgi:glucosamine 6-phosphate synthetase-like amidotransferase/phosphosugar isomerase protein
MCGISGAKLQSKKDINEYVQLLKKQDIRGKDFFGIGILRKGKFHVYKFTGGATEAFSDSVIQLKINDVCIAQNRLAFFGLNLENTQPLYSNRIALVINGNLLNHKQLFEKYQITQQLEVDSEIVLRLIEYHMKKTRNIKTAIARTIEEIKGTYAMIILDFNKVEFHSYSNLMPLKHQKFISSI